MIFGFHINKWIFEKLLNDYLHRCKLSAERFTFDIKFGSSELSASCLATPRTRLAKRAMFDVFSTIPCGCRLAIEFSHNVIYFNIASSKSDEIDKKKKIK